VGKAQYTFHEALQITHSLHPCISGHWLKGCIITSSRYMDCVYQIRDRLNMRREKVFPELIYTEHAFGFLGLKGFCRTATSEQASTIVILEVFICQWVELQDDRIVRSSGHFMLFDPSSVPRPVPCMQDDDLLLSDTPLIMAWMMYHIPDTGFGVVFLSFGLFARKGVR